MKKIGCIGHDRTTDLYERLHSMSKSLEGSGRLDEHDNPDAYDTVLDAMAFVRCAPRKENEAMNHEEQIDDPRLPCAASALSAGLGAWLPIETAPKDGSLILVTGCNGSKTVVAAAWKGPSEEDGFDKPRWVGWLGLYELGLAEPKFWHPLPEAPNAVIEGAEGGLPPKAPARMEG